VADETQHDGGETQGGPAGAQRPATGDARVDAALAPLDELAGRPVTEHAAIFEDVHRRLTAVLGELDPAPGQRDGDAGGPKAPSPG